MNRKTRPFLTLILLSLVAVTLTYQAYSISRLNEKIAKLQETNSLATTLDDADAQTLNRGPVTDPWATAGVGSYAPFTTMWQMQQQMDELLDSVFQGERTFSTGGLLINTATPTISVNESNEDYQVVIDVPDDSEVELATELEDNVIRLTGSVSYQGSNNQNRLASSFTSRSQFSRSIPLSKPVDPLGLFTDKQDGRIVISVPKA